MVEARSSQNDDVEAATVCIVDDDRDVRRTLARTVGSAGWSVETYESGRSFLAEVDEREPKCVVLDVRMPHLSGLSVQRELAARRIACPVVFISGHSDVPAAVEGMRRGATDFLQKPFSPHRLLMAVEKAVAHGEELQNEASQRHRAQVRLARLSDREREVLELLMRGRLNKQIADELGIAERTVEVHRSSCMKKLEASTIVDLVRQYFTATGS